MSSIQICRSLQRFQPLPPSLFATDEIPLTVKQALFIFGVSRKRVFWVSVKQIPHLA